VCRSCPPAGAPALESCALGLSERDAMAPRARPARHPICQAHIGGPSVPGHRHRCWRMSLFVMRALSLRCFFTSAPLGIENADPSDDTPAFRGMRSHAINAPARQVNHCFPTMSPAGRHGRWHSVVAPISASLALPPTTRWMTMPLAWTRLGTRNDDVAGRVLPAAVRTVAGSRSAPWNAGDHDVTG
jgi:hypothetical protein